MLLAVLMSYKYRSKHIKLNRLEQFINKFSSEGVYMTGEELHSHLDQIEKYMVSTLRPHLVLQPHLPVAHLPFYLEADR